MRGQLKRDFSHIVESSIIFAYVKSQRGYILTNVLKNIANMFVVFFRAKGISSSQKHGILQMKTTVRFPERLSSKTTFQYFFAMIEQLISQFSCIEHRLVAQTKVKYELPKLQQETIACLFVGKRTSIFDFSSRSVIQSNEQGHTHTHTQRRAVSCQGIHPGSSYMNTFVCMDVRTRVNGFKLDSPRIAYG